MLSVEVTSIADPSQPLDRDADFRGVGEEMVTRLERAPKARGAKVSGVRRAERML